MRLNNVSPAPRTPPDTRKHLIPFTVPGPWPARILYFAGPFWEKFINARVTRKCEPTDKNARPRVRIHCELDRLHDRNGDPLVLSIKYRWSTEPDAELTQLVAGLVGVSVEHVADMNLELSDFVGRRVDALLCADREGFARIESLAAIALSDSPLKADT
jgi:hypothetical protein